jgi:anti-sigma factor RsiW
VVYDARHAPEHPETAGWALGTLDPDDATAFSGHLRSCEQCQAEVAEFTPVAGSLPLAAPSAEPPDDLFYKTMAAVQYAVMAEGQPATEPELTPPKPVARASRWWHFHWTSPLMTAVAALGAAAVTAAAFIGVQLSQITAPAVLASFDLRAPAGGTGSAPPRSGITAAATTLCSPPRTCPGLARASSTSAGTPGRATARAIPIGQPGQEGQDGCGTIRM